MEQLPVVCEVPPLGLRFVDGKTVYILRDGKALGPATPYTLRGDRVSVKHSCGTWVLQTQPGGLYHQEFKRLFVKQ